MGGNDSRTRKEYPEWKCRLLNGQERNRMEIWPSAIERRFGLEGGVWEGEGTLEGYTSVYHELGGAKETSPPPPPPIDPDKTTQQETETPPSYNGATGVFAQLTLTITKSSIMYP